MNKIKVCIVAGILVMSSLPLFAAESDNLIAQTRTNSVWNRLFGNDNNDRRNYSNRNYNYQRQNRNYYERRGNQYQNRESYNNYQRQNRYYQYDR